MIDLYLFFTDCIYNFVKIMQSFISSAMQDSSEGPILGAQTKH